MRSNLWDDPRVAALVDATDTNEAMIVGGLYWLWATADQHSEDGFLPGLTLRQIDRKTCIPGLGEALTSIGWLAPHESGLEIVRFEDHNGASAKRRATDAQRKSNVRNLSASDADTERTDGGRNAPNCGAREREEKEIEKEEKKPRVRAAATTSIEGVPDTLLADYLALRKAKKAGPLTDTAIAGLRREGGKAGLTLSQTITACVEFGWQGFNAGWYAERTKGAVPVVSGQHVDPDSRPAIEAEGIAKGIGPWNETEQWHIYKARVRGQQQKPLSLDQLAGMAARRQEVH